MFIDIYLLMITTCGSIFFLARESLLGLCPGCPYSLCNFLCLLHRKQSWWRVVPGCFTKLSHSWVLACTASLSLTPEKLLKWILWDLFTEEHFNTRHCESKPCQFSKGSNWRRDKNIVILYVIFIPRSVSWLSRNGESQSHIRSYMCIYKQQIIAITQVLVAWLKVWLMHICTYTIDDSCANNWAQPAFQRNLISTRFPCSWVPTKWVTHFD